MGYLKKVSGFFFGPPLLAEIWRCICLLSWEAKERDRKIVYVVPKARGCSGRLLCSEEGGGWSIDALACEVTRTRGRNDGAPQGLTTGRW